MIDSLYMTYSSLLSHTWCFEDRVIWIPIQPLAARVVGNYGEPKTKWDSYIIVYISLRLLVSIYLIVHVNSLLFHENHIHSKVGSWHGFLLLKHMSPDTPLHGACGNCSSFCHETLQINPPLSFSACPTQHLAQTQHSVPPFHHPLQQSSVFVCLATLSLSSLCSSLGVCYKGCGTCVNCLSQIQILHVLQPSPLLPLFLHCPAVLCHHWLKAPQPILFRDSPAPPPPTR